MTGRPPILTEELAATIEELAPMGLPIQSIARSIGIKPDTLSAWLSIARNGQGNPLHDRILKAIQAGTLKVEQRALANITASEDNRDWQWMLTHHPQLRDTWSDAAAERRAVTAAMAAVAKGIQAANLPPDQALALINHIQAQGIKLPGDDADG